MKKYIPLLLLALSATFVGCVSADKQSFSNPLKEGDGSATVSIAVYITVEPDKRDAFMEEMMTLLEAAQKEPGTLEYTLWGDLNDNNTFFLYEEYITKDAFNAHSTSDAFKKFVKRLDEIGGIKLRLKTMDVKSAPISEKKQ